ncbi:hypothetical protein F5878DRAFT_643542 [Lentinula raphanica]|uniref:Uncharacterized protein n=1 Tax=Lentinula raphanica TaxID=153919 RepID=A0AA38P500_9AGAR|nr:hypothetical protein F5878DRAFT_643542 [Lentinula raphanica]
MRLMLLWSLHLRTIEVRPAASPCQQDARAGRITVVLKDKDKFALVKTGPTCLGSSSVNAVMTVKEWQWTVLVAMLIHSTVVLKDKVKFALVKRRSDILGVQLSCQRLLATVWRTGGDWRMVEAEKVDAQVYCKHRDMNDTPAPPSSRMNSKPG